MKKIKFLRGFRGILTQEQHYKQFEVVELNDSVVDNLLAQGVVELCKTVPKKKPVKKKATTTRGKK